MKRISAVLTATMLAVVFSAFTPASTPTEIVHFLDDNGVWQSEALTPCPEGLDPVCIKTTTNYGNRRIFKSESESDPYYKQ